MIVARADAIRWWCAKHLRCKQLVREPLVVREKASDTWHSMEDGFGGELERHATSRWRSAAPETIKQAVIAGMGVSFVSAHTMSQEPRAGSLCVLDVEGFPLMLQLVRGAPSHQAPAAGGAGLQHRGAFRHYQTDCLYA